MAGLSKAPVIKESPLLGRDGESLWITAHKLTFLAHLRHVALRKPPSWQFRVVSDAQMMTAWLATASLKGAEIFDADAVSVSLTHATLVDLVEPPELLVVYLGIKAARNEAMPEVLLETLTHRGFLGKPTWLWDQPSHPLSEGHLSYSSYIADYLSDWPHLNFKTKLMPRRPVQPKAAEPGESAAQGGPEPGLPEGVEDISKAGIKRKKQTKGSKVPVGMAGSMPSLTDLFGSDSEDEG